MFTRENTKEIKGIAILLMLAHHLCGFPDKIPYGMGIETGLMISGKELTDIIGLFSKICVSLYMFLGGYGLYKKAVRIEDGQVIIKNALAKNIVALYKSYWKVFLVFVPIGFLFFSNQVQYCANESACFRYAEWSLEKFLMNFTGLSYSLNSEWWFLFYYIFALFEGYIFLELFKNSRNLYSEYSFVIVWHILLTKVFPIIPFREGLASLGTDIWYKNIFLGSEFSISFFVGIIFAKYSIFESWKKELEKLSALQRSVIALFVLFLVVYVRVFFVSNAFDIVLVPLLVIGCHTLIETTKIMKKPLGILGKHNTNMWLTHSFYCYYFGVFSKMVFGTNNLVLAFLILLALSLVTSFWLERFWTMVSGISNKIFVR